MALNTTSVIYRVSHAKAAKQISWMMLVTLVTQVVSIYKASVVAASFGASTELDAYYFGNNIATFFLSFVTIGITTVIIPAYVKKLKRSSIDTLITVIFLGVIMIMLLTYFFRGQVVEVLTNRETEFKDYFNNMLLLSLGIQLLPAFLVATTAYYQSNDRFNLPKVILMGSNLAVVVILSIWKNFTIYQYLYVLLGGSVLQFVVDIAFAMKYGFRFRFTFALKDEQFLEMLRVLLPTILSTGMFMFSTLISSLLTSNLGTGELTIFSYANMIVGMVNSMIIGNLTAYVFPKIIKRINEGNESGQRALWGYAIIFHAGVCLLVAGFLGVGREFIGILFEHGRFTSGAADTVYQCMCIYVFGQQANIVRDLFYRYFFANGDTKSTMKNGLMTSCLNIALSLALSFVWGLYGIVFGTLISGSASLIGIFVKYKKKYGTALKVGGYIREFIKTEAAVVLTVGVTLFFKRIYLPDSAFIAFVVFGTLTIIMFFGSMAVLRSKVLKLGSGIF